MISVLQKTLLENRGIKTQEEQDNFLNPNYESGMHDPFLFSDMEKSCARIFEAIEKNEKIVIYSDYDCDGIPGAVILYDFFKKIGYENFSNYIPHRHDEGYGLHLEALDTFISDGVKLLITIDLGISAIDEIKKAQNAGMDVIVCDHHLPEEKLPEAFAILNPKTCDYPEKMLCGAGVVFKLVQGLIKFALRPDNKIFVPAPFSDYRVGHSDAKILLSGLQAGFEKWLLDMAGLATLSDMVPLLGENRTIASFGIKVLQKSPRPGLQKLLAKLSIDQRYLSEDDITFMITPRINAASRMDIPRRAFELLSENDEVVAGSLADHLSKINDERKVIVGTIMREINKNFEKKKVEGLLPDIVVVGNPDWNPGVLGLIAGKICDQYEKPVFVWGGSLDGVLKGSCRSDGSVSVVELMTKANESFVKFGGHELAGGFSILHDQVHFLEEKLVKIYKEIKNDFVKESDMHDAVLALSQVGMKEWGEISALAPFGFGNKKPVFLFENVLVKDVKAFGKEKNHLEIIVADQSCPAKKAIAFFAGHDSFEKPIIKGGSINLLASFDLSRFAGRTELRLRIVDVR